MCNENIKKEKRIKILEAAYQLFLKNGYKSTKIIDIAEAAGIGKGTVYEYFKSKEALLLSILTIGTEEYVKSCKKLLEKESSSMYKLQELIDIEANLTKESGPRLLKLSQLLTDENDGLPPGLLKKAQELWEKQYSIMQCVIAQGIDDGEFRQMDSHVATIVIMGAIGSYLKIKYAVCGFEDLELPFDAESFQRESLIEFILKGIQA